MLKKQLRASDERAQKIKAQPTKPEGLGLITGTDLVEGEKGNVILWLPQVNTHTHNM